MVGRGKKAIFNFVKEKVWRKMSSWSRKSFIGGRNSYKIYHVVYSYISY